VKLSGRHNRMPKNKFTGNLIWLLWYCTTHKRGVSLPQLRIQDWITEAWDWILTQKTKCETWSLGRDELNFVHFGSEGSRSQHTTLVRSHGVISITPFGYRIHRPSDTRICPRVGSSVILLENKSRFPGFTKFEPRFSKLFVSILCVEQPK
jgi:hypothetical protein